VSFALLDAADWIFTMTRGQRDSIVELMPECQPRARMLSEKGEDIADPAAKSLQEYRQVRASLVQGVTEALRLIAGEAARSGNE
jgi:protein-tyrosine-phosphatase